jgi:hypothetical protein
VDGNIRFLPIGPIRKGVLKKTVNNGGRVVDKRQIAANILVREAVGITATIFTRESGTRMGAMTAKICI